MRKSSNDDESVHGQKKRRPSNKVEGNIKNKMVNRRGLGKGRGQNNHNLWCRGSEKRNSSNDDESVHGQEKRMTLKQS